ncbi:hypothetical protein [Streptomyces olivaceoviridis]
MSQLCAHLQDVCATAPDVPAGIVDTRAVLTWLVTRRPGMLTEGARELVLIASVLGGTLTVQRLARVLDRPEPALIAA